MSNFKNVWQSLHSGLSKSHLIIDLFLGINTNFGIQSILYSINAIYSAIFRWMVELQIWNCIYFRLCVCSGLCKQKRVRLYCAFGLNQWQWIQKQSNSLSKSWKFLGVRKTWCAQVESQMHITVTLFRIWFCVSIYECLHCS